MESSIAFEMSRKHFATQTQFALVINTLGIMIARVYMNLDPIALLQVAKAKRPASMSGLILLSASVFAWC